MGSATPMPLRIAILVLFAACAFEPATDVSVYTLRSDTTSTDEETVDLSVPTNGYVFEDGAALDPELRARVDLVCPDGTEMGFDDWYSTQPEILRRAFEGRRTSIAATLETALHALRDSDPTCNCDVECWYCPDGAVICAFDCADFCI